MYDRRIRRRWASPKTTMRSKHSRLIGSIRRECVDRIIVPSEAHLRRILNFYARCYNETRTHLALDKDAPVSRPVQRTGVVRSLGILGGLHHHYARA
jgi:hypothetical protein